MTQNIDSESGDELAPSQKVREVIIGTYEDYVIGYTIESNDIKKLGNKKKSYSLEQSFAVRAHSGSVRSLSANQDGSLTFSGGFDEMFNIFGLKRRKLLHTMEGAYSCATFVDRNHLICGGEIDGKIIIYNCKNASITQVKTLIGHKSPIKSLSVHPSGKVLLSISRDNTLRTWNLIKGRQAYVSNNLNSQAHLVKWSRTGNEFVIAANNEIYLYNNSTGKLSYTFKLEKRVNSIEFITEKLFMVATDSGILEFFNLKTGQSLFKHKAHETRIKSVQMCDPGHELDGSVDDEEEEGSDDDVNDDDCDDDDSKQLFVTASSDGQVKLWSIDIMATDGKPMENPMELACIDTGARLTCMTTVTYKS